MKKLTLFILALSLSVSLNAMIVEAGNEAWRNRSNVIQDWDYFTCNCFSIQHPYLFGENNPAFFLLRNMNNQNILQTYNKLQSLPANSCQDQYITLHKLMGDWIKEEKTHICEYFFLTLQRLNIPLTALGNNGIPSLTQWNTLFYPNAPVN